MPLVSIISCTYNRGHFIGDTIASVLNQTVTDFEFIIVDESSTDNTEEIVKNFGDPRILYYKIPNTKGHLSKLRNYGLRRSKGKYIAFIDSDDLWDTNKLELQVVALDKNPSVGFSYSDALTFNSEGVINPSMYNRSGDFMGPIFESFLHNKFPIWPSTLLFRRECGEKVGWEDEEIKNGDFLFIMSLAAHYESYAIYQPITQLRRHDDNWGDREHLTEMPAYFKVLDKLVQQKIITPKMHENVSGRICYAFGIQLTAAKKYRAANKYFWKNILHNPIKPKPWIRLVMNLPYTLFG